MRLSANRSGWRPADPGSYWRRRFFILGGGIAVLAVLAWLFTGARPGAAAAAPAAARSSAAAPLASGALPAAAYGSPWASPSPQPSATVTATAATGARCAPGDVVLSLFPAQPAYSQTARPRFDVFAVSSSVTQCQLAFGPGSVTVIVTRHGRVVWNSAACKLSGAPVVRFTPGVPQLLTISWNRAAASPAGCAGSLSPGAWGTFDAFAVSAGRSSPGRSFKLLR